VLFVDAVQYLGFGARIVSGYLYEPDCDAVGSVGTGSTHAWAEIYVPGAGWIMFDPTKRSIGGFNLIPVAWRATSARRCRFPAASLAPRRRSRRWKWLYRLRPGRREHRRRRPASGSCPTGPSIN
jgi:transglutaminase-like putative cysteine protease